MLRLCKEGNCTELENYLIATKERESEARVLHLANIKNELKYTPLHTAIFARNLDLVKLLMKYGADPNIKCCGTPSVHLALCSAMLPSGLQFGLQCLDVLLEGGANLQLKDDNGFTALHLAAEFNLATVIPKLIQAAAPELIINISCRMSGLTALHRAAYSDARESLSVLLDNGADLASRDVYGFTALHVAGYFGRAKAWEVLSKRGADKADKNASGNTAVDLLTRAGWLVSSSDASVINRAHGNVEGVKTAIVSNELCVKHHTCPPSTVESTSAPPENVKRLHVIVNEVNGALRSSELESKLFWVNNSKEAVMSDVLRVHEWSYVRQVQAKCESVTSYDAETEEGQAFLDGDTTICKNTFNAALAAAGAVCHGVDLVVNEQARNAFCPIRPPGHHAGPRGLVKLGVSGGPDSHGFCILNNISIGAAYAMNRYRDTVKKVAIVDFDVHHGNGTEETVRWLKPGLDVVPMINDVCFGQIHAPRYKPWFDENDPNNVLFVSVHGYGPREKGLEHMFPVAAFYPGSGPTALPDINAHTNNGKKESSGHDMVSSVGKSSSDTVRMEEDDDDDDNENEGEGGDDEDESEDDEDFEGGEEDDQEDDEDDDDDDEDFDGDEPIPVSAEPNDQENGSVLSARVNALHRVFSTPSASKINSDCGVHGNEMKPLILDVGVPLPSEESMTDPLLNIAGGKAINELSYRVQWRKYFRDEIFPRLMTFQPDMIFISAGFDAHKKDTINGGYIALIEEDFEWVTDQLVNIANSCCNGRIVSALEGGYQLGGEFTSAFAKSVKVHVTSLIHGCDRLQRYTQEQCDKDTAIETKFIEKLEAIRDEELARREQIRLERLAQEEQRLLEIQQQYHDNQSESSSSGHVEESSDVVESESSNKKRRRPQVDYQALDKELRESKSNA